jgi:hypothetical protein
MKVATGKRHSVIVEAGRWRWRFVPMRTRTFGFQHDGGCPGFRAGAVCLTLKLGMLTGIRRNQRS